MRSILKNPALAGQSWTAPTSGRTYQVDGNGLANIIHDDEAKGTADTSEAMSAGFDVYAEPARIRLSNPEYGKRKVRVELVPGDVEMREEGARIWRSATDHQYHADDAGVIECLEFDVEEAGKAGFVPA